MICTATPEQLAALTPQSEALVRILSLWEAYGNDCPFCRFWMGEGGSVFALVDGVATLHAGVDVEEAALFLTMSPDVHKVHTDADTAVLLAEQWGTAAETGTVMRADKPLLPVGEAETLPPREIYPLLSAVFGEAIPPFDVWYADVHHRWRRDAFHTAAVRRGEVVSCAITVAETADAVLVGGVATDLAFRGQGIASACVSTLAHRLQAAGKTVWISPKNAGAEALYQRLGFSSCGYWGTAVKTKG